MDKTRKNTVKIVFPNATKVPAHLDVIRFTMNVLKLPATCIHSIYKDENDHCFYIKFLDDLGFNQFATNLEEEYLFSFNDGQSTTVKLEVASRLFRYVRIFNLPPETEDKEIASVLGRFGIIRQHVRERYPIDYGYSVYSGIRGVHMEIAREIPANLHIGHFKARLYYDGLKNKCFFCKQEGHVKADCPKAVAAREVSNAINSHSNSKNTDGTITYKSIVAGAVANNRIVEPNLPLTMTPLPPRNNRNASKAISTNTKPTREITKSIDADQDGQEEAAGPADLSDNEASSVNFVMVARKRGKQSKSASGDSSGADEPSRRGRSKSKKPSVLGALETRTRSRSAVNADGKTSG